MGRLTTHVLDTAQGRPAAGVRITLLAKGAGPEPLCRAVTNADGRCDRPLLEGEALRVGEYDLVFAIGDYFAAQGIALPEPRFLNEIVLRFGVADTAQHYHVPLLASPWSFSTYRGS